jgi:DNA-nicking Smr family endonuclease
VPQQRRRDEQDVVASLLSDDYSPDIETGEELLFVRGGLQQRVLRKLRRGQFAIEAELDLHGYIVPEAREALAVFLRDAQLTGKRCVRIIHGKGTGTLRRAVREMLKRHALVRGHSAAAPRAGGDGVTVVEVAH